ncbi:MAG: hypothetical protein NC484_08495 [Alloprevotella sp.]|nr:hypothetical protein [Alloprevotella sp.]
MKALMRNTGASQSDSFRVTTLIPEGKTRVSHSGSTSRGIGLTPGALLRSMLIALSA